MLNESEDIGRWQRKETEMRDKVEHINARIQQYKGNIRMWGCKLYSEKRINADKWVNIINNCLWSFNKENLKHLDILVTIYAFLKTRTHVNSKLYPLKSAGASRSGPVTTCQSRDPADKSQGRVSPARTNHNTDPQHERRYLTKVATIYEIMLVLNTAVKCLGWSQKLLKKINCKI